MTACLVLAATALSFGASVELARDPVSFFSDLTLEHGFRLSATRSSTQPNEVGVVLARTPGIAPPWRLAQWGTQFSLESAGETLLPDGTRILANEGKSVTILPGGLAGEGILLEVMGGVEYGGKARTHGEPWPHLLVEQRLDGVRLHTLATLEFQVAFRIEKCAPATDQPLDPSLHTAHINAFWTIHNTNPNSADHNDMIWFGLPLFDARYPIPRGHQAVDGGQEDASGKFICTIEGARFYSEPVIPGQWHILACDMLPLVREALAAAQQQGFMVESHFEDLDATTFNLGWEVPGPYDCAIHLRHLKFEGRTRPE